MASRTCALIVAVGLLLLSETLCGEEGLSDSLPPARLSYFLGRQSCNSTACHTSPVNRRRGGHPGLQEYALYNQHDPHARAGHTLASDAFAAILNRLTDDPDPSSESSRKKSGNAVYARCAACHDPEGMGTAMIEGREILAPKPGESVSSRGIGCESCHGGAKQWIALHDKPQFSINELAQTGMIDNRNVFTRASTCAACHVGSATAQVDHDMIAAGHPPLRFELAAYHRKLSGSKGGQPRAHWNDAWEHINTPEFETRLWVAGQFVSANQSLSLLAMESARAGEPQDNDTTSTWPEFAQYDCFACHQSLRTGEDSSTSTGLPAWNQWNMGLTEALSKADFQEPARKLRAAFTGEAISAKQIAEGLRSQLQQASLSDAPSMKTVLDICALEPRSLTWENLCHRYLALVAAQRTIRDEFLKLKLRGPLPRALDSWESDDRVVRMRLTEVAGQLAFESSERDMPSMLGKPGGLKQVHTALTEIAGQLQSLHHSLVGSTSP